MAGCELHFTDDGEGEEPPIVLLHGMSSTHADFEQVVPLLRARWPDRRVVAVDRPGYGWSRGGALGFHDQIEAIHALLGEVDAAPAVVVGHSMGAAMALGLAIAYPGDVSALVLVAPAAGGIRNRRPARAMARAVKALHLPVVKQVGDVLFSDLLRKSIAHAAMRRAFGDTAIDEEHRRRVLSVTLSDDNLDAIAVDRLEFNAAGEWLDANCAAVEAPVTIVAAGDDDVVPVKYARRLAKMLARAELRETIGGHTLPHTNPEAVAMAVASAIPAQEER